MAEFRPFPSNHHSPLASLTGVSCVDLPEAMLSAELLSRDGLAQHVIAALGLGG